jgi:hypothetical protein
MYGERRGAYRFLVGNMREIPLGKFRRIWEDNIKLYLQQMGCWDMDKIIWLSRTGGGLL